jgi:PAS domain S-box-containing protein
VTISPVKDSSGNVVGGSNVARDITDRKVTEAALHAAQEQLRAHEEHLRLAQWAAHIGTFDLNFRTGVNIWTPETEALYGLPPGGFGGTLTDFENLIHPDDRQRVIELTHEAMRTGQPSAAEWRVVWPDGSIHWIAGLGQALMDESGERSRMLGVNIDITERKHSEKSLRESEERFRTLYENATLGLYRTTPDGKILLANPSLVKMLGFSSFSELAQRNLEEEGFEPSYKRTEFHRLMATEGEVKGLETSWKRKDGTTIFIREGAKAVRDAEGKIVCYEGTVEDITKRKEAEEALSNMTRKLVEAQEQERARIARELHDDINQRLALVAIGLDQLREKHKDLPSEVRDHLQELRQMTSDTSSSVYALSHELYSSVPDSLGLAKGMRSWCKTFSQRQELDIDFRSHDVPKPSQEISLCLFRVLQEAVHNAGKHSGAERIDVQLAENAGEIHLIVSDSGKGFDIEKARQSQGLGLTSMQERVRLVGGTIVINSTRLAGTTIHVCVPFKVDAAK